MYYTPTPKEKPIDHNNAEPDQKKKANPFTLFLILILLILSDIGAMALVINAIKNHYIGK